MTRVHPKTLSLHPDAGCVPEMSDEEYPAFLADVRENGVRKPIEVGPGTLVVVDGRTRLRAALEAGLADVPIEDAILDDDESAALYMLKAAVLRRHLTTGQRALLGEQMTGLKRGQRSDAQNCASDVVTQEEAAKAVGVSRRTVQDAATVKAKGTPEEVEAVQKGKAKVSRTAREIERREREANAPETLVDPAGTPVPPALRSLFADRWLTDLGDQVQEMIDEGVGSLVACVRDEGSAHTRLEREEIIGALELAGGQLGVAVRRIKRAIPVAVCGGCLGKGCKPCDGHGYVC